MKGYNSIFDATQKTHTLDEIIIHLAEKNIASLMLIGIDIQLFCINGLVILEGTVSSMNQVDAIIQVIKKVPGVRGVKSKLIVRRVVQPETSL